MKSKASKFCGGALAVVMALLGLAGSAFFALLVLLIPVNVHGRYYRRFCGSIELRHLFEAGSQRHYYQNRNHQRRDTRNRLA